MSEPDFSYKLLPTHNTVPYPNRPLHSEGDQSRQSIPSFPTANLRRQMDFATQDANRDKVKDALRVGRAMSESGR